MDWNLGFLLAKLILYFKGLPPFEARSWWVQPQKWLPREAGPSTQGQEMSLCRILVAVHHFSLDGLLESAPFWKVLFKTSSHIRNLHTHLKLTDSHTVKSVVMWQPPRPYPPFCTVTPDSESHSEALLGWGSHLAPPAFKKHPANTRSLCGTHSTPGCKAGDPPLPIDPQILVGQRALDKDRSWKDCTLPPYKGTFSVHISARSQ